MDDLDDAGAAFGFRVLSLQRIVAFDHRGQDPVQHFVGFGIELAVLHDAGDLRVDLFAEGVVLRGAELAAMHGGQLRIDRVADRRHALAQRLVAGPLLAGIQLQRGRAVLMLVSVLRGRMRAGTEGKRSGGQQIRGCGGKGPVFHHFISIDS